MKLVARMVILAGIFTMPILANAQSGSTTTGAQADSQRADSSQTARVAKPVPAGNDGSGVNGQSNKRYPAEVTYSSYSPPIYVAR